MFKSFLKPQIKALIDTLTVSAIIHFVFLLLDVLTTRSLVSFNYFKIIEIDKYFKNIDFFQNNNIGILVTITVYGYFLLRQLKKKES